MAKHLMPLLYFTLHLLALSAYGRSLVSTNDGPVKVNTVNRAAYTGKTNSSDFEGLREIVDAFPLLLSEDNPDPCLPPQWSWIQCNSDPQPRVIALDLYMKGLAAFTVPDFSSMDALQKIDLHRNSFYGEIPDFLGNFPVLEELNLAYNSFMGNLPDSIACNKKLKLRVDGNALLMDSIKCPISTSSTTDVPSTSATPSSVGSDSTTYVYTTKKKSKTPVVVGSSVSVFSLISIAVGIFAIFRHKAKTAAAIAAAGAQKPSDEVPMNTPPTPINMSPQPQPHQY